MKTVRSLIWSVFLLAAAASVAVFAQQPRPNTPAADPRPDPRVDVRVQDPTSPEALYGYAMGQHAWRTGSAQLAHKYVQSESEDDKASVRKELRDALAKEFDQHLGNQQKELEGVEKQIERMRSLAEKRKEAKSKIVERRIDQLVAEAKGEGWADGQAGSSVNYDLLAANQVLQDHARQLADMQVWSQDGRVFNFTQPGQGLGKLIKNYVDSDSKEDKTELRGKITELLGKQFDEHMKRQEKELKELEKQVTNLRTLIKKRRDAKKDIVDRRMEQLILDAEGLGWGTPGGFIHSGAGAYFMTTPPAPLAPAPKARNQGQGKGKGKGKGSDSDDDGGN